MPKPKIFPDTEGSGYAAWCPQWGTFDIRWAAEYESRAKKSRFDTDLDLLLDLDQQYYFA